MKYLPVFYYSYSGVVHKFFQQGAGAFGSGFKMAKKCGFRTSFCHISSDNNPKFAPMVAQMLPTGGLQPSPGATPARILNFLCTFPLCLSGKIDMTAHALDLWTFFYSVQWYCLGLCTISPISFCLNPPSVEEDGFRFLLIQ